MIELTFDHSIQFSENPLRPHSVSVAVSLSSPYMGHARLSRPIGLLACIDTASTFCLFQRQYAGALGIEVEAGEPMIVRGVTNRVRGYQHFVNIRISDIEFQSAVLFYEDSGKRLPNLLGIRGFLEHLRLAIVYSDSRLFVSPYSD